MSKAGEYLKDKKLDTISEHDYAGGSEIYINENDVLKVMTDFSNQENKVDAYCPTCDCYIVNERVDNNECCDKCGTEIEWRSAIEQENEELRDIIEKLWKDIPLDAKNFWELRLGPMKQYFNKKS